jgi:hypothetical protein
MEPLEGTVRKYRVRRMDDTRLPKKILFETVARGKKSAGKPKKNWVDCLEENTGEHTVRVMDRKGEKLSHLAEINLVPNLRQGKIGPLLLFLIDFVLSRKAFNNNLDAIFYTTPSGL